MTKKKPKEKRIEDILQAAMDEFVERGYEGASMNAIAVRAGISKGGLYHHFSSKDEILIYANQKLYEPIYGKLERIGMYPSVKEGLVNYIRDYLSYWISHPKELAFFTLSMNKALTMTEFWGLYEESTEGYIQALESVISKGIEIGELVPHKARSSAITLMTALDGALAYLVLDRKLELDEMIESFISRLIGPLLNKK